MTGKFGLGVQNEAGKRVTEICQENTSVIPIILFPKNTRDDSTHRDHQMVSIEIRLIILIADEDEALHILQR